MADRFYRILAALQMDTGLVEDQMVNTWHFAHRDIVPGTTPQDSANDMIDQVETFYQGIANDWLGSSCGTTVICRAYDLAEAEPRVPVLTRNITIAPSGTDSLPHEVAVVLSLKADAPSGTDPARRRGRVYLGPISRARAQTLSARIRISDADIASLVAAAVAAFDTGLTAQDPDLCIYSRTTDLGGATLADSFFDVVEVKVDSAFDTQRRRGQASLMSASSSIGH